MPKEKLFLILERSEYKLDVKKDEDNDYILEGVFAEFGVENVNQRIYEEKEYLPHLEYLKEKIEKNNLVGELDHPNEFEIKYANVSHKIESLEYVKEKRQIIGKIKLLDTDAGKNAKAMLDGGVQLNISSRAAGVVKENKKVDIKRLFTYDLVADPGFKNAQVNKVAESFGIVNENVAMYDMSDKLSENKIEGYLGENSNDNSPTATIAEIDNYTKILKEEIKNLKGQFNDLKNGINIKEGESGGISISEKIENIENHLIELTDKQNEIINETNNNTTEINDLTDFSNENRSSINIIEEHSKHIVDESNLIKETISNNVKIINDIVNESNTNSDFNDDLSIKLNELIEESNVNNKFNGNLSTKLNELIEENNISEEFNNKLVEKVNSIIDELEVYETQSNDLVYKFNDAVTYIKENLSEAKKCKDKDADSDDKNENENDEEALHESNSNLDLSENNNYEDISSKVDRLIQEAKEKKVNSTINELDFIYFNTLPKEQQEQFLTFESSKQDRIKDVFLKAKPTDERSVALAWNSALYPSKQDEIFENAVALMPDEYKPVWESLSEENQSKILRQAKSWNLRTDDNIVQFWESRNVLNNLVKNRQYDISESNSTLDKDLGYSESQIDRALGL